MIICICDETISGNKYEYLTLGKQYISYPDNHRPIHRFYITNDAGMSCNYPLRNFMTLDKWRHIQLDKLVDENIKC